MSDDLEAAFSAAWDSAENTDSDTEDFDLGAGADINMGDDPDDSVDDSSTQDDETVSQETDSVDDDDDDSGADDSVNPEAFDWSEHKDKLVTVKVDGELIQVPLAEAMNGYMRQKHFTQATQALAEQKRLAEWAHELQSAIRNDPRGTLKSLQAALGLDGPDQDPYEDMDPEIQPLARTIEAQRAELAQLRAEQDRLAEEAETQRLFAEVKAEVADVRSRYDDFDAQAVLPLAAERGLSVEDAYKLWKADQFIKSADARRKAEAAAAKKAEAQAAKRAATQKVSRGGSSSGSAGDPDPKGFESFEDLLLHNLSRQ